MEVLKNGSMGNWKHGSMETWKHRNINTLRHEIRESQGITRNHMESHVSPVAHGSMEV